VKIHVHSILASEEGRKECDPDKQYAQEVKMKDERTPWIPSLEN
jgi:hypothetical protein